MRWEDERYVRFYTRDTPEWLALSWQARGLFGLIIRAVDRAGVMPVGKLGLKGVAVAVRAPWADVEGPLGELLEDGCVVYDAALSKVLVPNYIEAQEASQSDAARKRASRERARACFGGSSNASESARVVTNCDDIESRIVTESHVQSQAVTRGHIESHAVTLCCAVPSRTEPNQNTPLASLGHPSPAAELDPWGLTPPEEPPAADRPTAPPTASEVVVGGSVRPKPKAKRQTPPRAAMTQDWQPSDETVARLRELTGVDPLQCLFRFREWFLAKGERRPGWDASFKNWVLKAHERGELRDKDTSPPGSVLRRADGKPMIQVYTPPSRELTAEESAAWLKEHSEMVDRLGIGYTEDDIRF